MLDRLPTEILVKVLKKCDRKTVVSSRLLNSHFNAVILRHDLDKIGLNRILIQKVESASYFNRRFKQAIFSIRCYRDDKSEPIVIDLYDMKELMLSINIIISKVNHLTDLSVFGFPVCQKFMNILLRSTFTSKLEKLALIDCSFDQVDGEMFSILESMKHLRCLRIKSGNYEEKASKDKTVSLDFTKMDLIFIEQFFKIGKVIELQHCNVHLNLEHLKEILQQIDSDNAPMVSWNFGTILGISFGEVKQIVKDSKGEYSAHGGMDEWSVTIRRLGNTWCNIGINCFD